MTDRATAAIIADAERLLRGDGGAPVRRRATCGGTAITTRLADVEPATVCWAWPRRVPLGRLTVLDGDPGLGKSAMGIDIGARLSVGAPMPDGSRPDLDGPAGTVLLTAEDGLADTVRPRLDAAGADPSRIVALRGVRAGEDGFDVRLPTVADVDAIAEACQQVDAALLVVDPLTAYLAGANSHRDSEVRGALAGLARLAEELGVAVLVVRHLNKSGGANPLYRGGGSIGIIAAARSGLLAARDPDDPDSGRRILATTKSNLAAEPPSLAWELEPAGDVVRIRWLGASERSAADLLAAPTGEERTAREAATTFLRESLAEGPVPATDLRADARGMGLGWRTIERAKGDLRIEAAREGFGAGGRWLWTLPAKARQAGRRPKTAGPSADFENVKAGRWVSRSGSSIDRKAPETAAYAPHEVLDAPADGTGEEGGT